jgi:hypothetical protein
LILYNLNIIEIPPGKKIPSGSVTIPFPAPMEEPKKIIRCRYLGQINVSKPSGMDVLNEAIGKIYTNAYEQYKKEKRLKKTAAKKKYMKMQKKSNIKDEDYFEVDDDDDDDDTISFDNLLDLNTEKNLGNDVYVTISPSNVAVRKVNDTTSNESGSENECESYSENLFECRIRYLSFIGIANDVRMCGFIMHSADNTFKCHAFLCENTSGPLCKTIEAACKVIFNKN